MVRDSPEELDSKRDTALPSSFLFLYYVRFPPRFSGRFSPPHHLTHTRTRERTRVLVFDHARNLRRCVTQNNDYERVSLSFDDRQPSNPCYYDGTKLQLLEYSSLVARHHEKSVFTCSRWNRERYVAKAAIALLLVGGRLLWLSGTREFTWGSTGWVIRHGADWPAASWRTRFADEGTRT